ncbi:uncharacterized protein LOC117649627 [Thrips palmi]|uniref:Uncharacterized protein LOC117649627 n=1 Tax=Thrips palmi TaxID=161013 RepID=A0A6P8ZT26_THRPL|nr:uncharacterized protein LOC117649627 [Thrips palmi]
MPSRLQLKEIHLPDDFGGAEFQYANDIALVELLQEVDITPYVLPVCVDWALDLPDLYPGEFGTIVGFGNTPEQSLTELHSVSLPVERSSVCRKQAPELLNFYSTQTDKFCVGFVNGSTVGQGDSGGGMTFPNEDRKWYLRGVVSVGSPRETTYSFFTNVTIFVPWMAKIIKKGEVSGRRCGVDVSEANVVDGAMAGRVDFPWEVDVYYQQAPSRGFQRLWSGALVSPKLVITTTLQRPPEGLHTDISVYPPSRIRVAARNITDTLDSTKTWDFSEVVRAYFPDDLLRHQGVTLNFIIFELKEPINLMPVCLDWSGSALLHLPKAGTTFHEHKDGSREWKRYFILNEAECRERLDEPPVSSKTTICVTLRESPHERLDRGHWIYNPKTTFGACAVKSQPLSSLEAFNFCTVQEGYDPESPSRSLFVNVDNVWFLRGILSFSTVINGNSISMYTDFSDAEVHRWLTKTRDFMGKPTCGDVSLCSALTPDQFVRGHMPWTVAVVVNGTERGSGLLVQPNAVITDFSLQLNSSQEAVPQGSTSNISILWQTADGTTETSRVLRVSVHEVKGQPDVALLELDPATPALTTPVCLDLSGSVLRPLATGQLGLVGQRGDHTVAKSYGKFCKQLVVESWHKWGPTNHNLVGGRSIDYFDCFNKFARSVGKFNKDSGFCISSEKNVLDPRVLGGGYLTYSGSKWFVQGLFTRYVKLRRENLAVAADFTHEGLRAWLRKKIDKIKSMPWKIPDNTSPKNCEGAGPTSPQECGVFVAQDERRGGGEGGQDDYLNDITLNRMQWNVNVYVDHGEGDLRVRAGTVVHPKMVLTSAIRLVNQNISEASPGGTQALMPTRNVTVHYNTADSRNTLIVDVTEIHVRKRSVTSWSVHYRYDMALLTLEVAVQLIPVCLPAPGSLGTTIPKLTPGSKGMVEVWSKPEINYWHYLVPALVKSETECVGIIPEVDIDVNIPADEFCAQYIEDDAEDLPADYGASFAVQTDGLWYLRGVVGINWRFHGGTGTQRTLFVFYNLDNPELLQWLHDKIGTSTVSSAAPSTPAATPASSSIGTTVPDDLTTVASADEVTETEAASNEPLSVTPLSPTPSTGATAPQFPSTINDDFTTTPSPKQSSNGSEVFISLLGSTNTPHVTWPTVGPLSVRPPHNSLTYSTVPEAPLKSNRDSNATETSTADRNEDIDVKDRWKQTAVWLGVALGIVSTAVIICALLAMLGRFRARSSSPVAALELVKSEG